ncbi:hypothetical protein M0R45_029410 [Rubus argutus]|uniref:Protein kinase domain-containing protein n=1 Tax=Rubus argutus TaxID=59490 RepID=A0AAW1W7K7_RUBAR
MLQLIHRVIFAVLYLYLCFCNLVITLLGDAPLEQWPACVSLATSPFPTPAPGESSTPNPSGSSNPPTSVSGQLSTFFSFSVSNLNPSSIGGGAGFRHLAGRRGSSETPAVSWGSRTWMTRTLTGTNVGLDLNSMVSSRVGDLGAVDIDLKSGDLVNCWIEYDGSSRVFNISVSYSNLKPGDPLLSFPLDLDQYVKRFHVCRVFRVDPGKHGDSQRPTGWSFSSSFDSIPSAGSTAPPPPTTTLMNPTANSVKSPPPSLAPSSSDTASSSSTSNEYYPEEHLDKALFEAEECHCHGLIGEKFCWGVASALTYLHQECENQVIHRDIKTSNIMLDEGFNARVRDFGLARQIEHDKSPDATVAAGQWGIWRQSTC